MPTCRILPAVARLTLLLATFSMSSIFIISVMKAYIGMEVKFLRVQDNHHFLDVDGEVIRLQAPNNTKVLRLPLDDNKLPLKPIELSKVHAQYNKTEEAKALDPLNNKGNNTGKETGAADNGESKVNEYEAQTMNVSSSNNVQGQQKSGKEVLTSTFVPIEPDTSPLRHPPDIPKTFLIEEADYCLRRPNLQIIAYVHSSISRVKDRMDTRRTWGNASAYDMGPMNVSVGVVFMVGRAKNKFELKIVQEESEKYHDIVQGNYGDHYRLLTYKGLAGLYWINKHCAHVPWTLHSDDDTHIDIFLYHRALQQLDAESEPKFVCSHMMGPALRVGRYKVRYEEYPAKEYPLYCSGGVWFLHTKFIKRLLLAKKTVPYLWVDDAYITGLLARRAGIGHLPFQKYYGGPHAYPERIGKEVVWFVKFAPRTEWWRNIVEYHKKYSMNQPATLIPRTST